MIQLPEWTPEYRAKVWRRALEINSDGCTGVPDFYLDACYEHDIHFRTHETLDGRVITFRESNYWFRKRIQTMSRFGVVSPMSWWRWAGVTLFGLGAWRAWNVT